MKRSAKCSITVKNWFSAVWGGRTYVESLEKEKKVWGLGLLYIPAGHASAKRDCRVFVWFVWFAWFGCSPVGRPVQSFS